MTVAHIRWSPSRRRLLVFRFHCTGEGEGSTWHSSKHITSPLIAAQKHCASNANPHRPRPNARKEHPSTFIPPYASRDRHHALPLFRKHQSSLENIKRRSQPSRNAPRNRPEKRTLQPRHLTSIPHPSPPPQSPLLHPLPQRKLNDSKRHLAQHRNAPPAIQLPPNMHHPARPPLPQNKPQRRPRRRKLPRLRPLLHHLRRHPHRARRHLPHARGEHVHARLPGAAQRRVGVREVPFYPFVGDEEECCSGRGADYC